MQFMDNMGVKNQDLIQKVFFMQKAASLANVAFATAENIVKADGYPVPFNLIAKAAAAATGAAQGAVIMSQQPPKKHMGGMAPDERPVRMLTGEAVLDRQTVSRIGGEPGLNRLLNGSGGLQPQISLIQPFKHFDRFLKIREKRKQAPKAMRGY